MSGSGADTSLLLYDEHEDSRCTYSYIALHTDYSATTSLCTDFNHKR